MPYCNTCQLPIIPLPKPDVTCLRAWETLTAGFDLNKPKDQKMLGGQLQWKDSLVLCFCDCSVAEFEGPHCEDTFTYLYDDVGGDHIKKKRVRFGPKK